MLREEILKDSIHVLEKSRFKLISLIESHILPLESRFRKIDKKIQLKFLLHILYRNQDLAIICL